MPDTSAILSDVCAREFMVCGFIFAALALLKLWNISRGARDRGTHQA